ncbi:DNA-directed RNA polymerase III subunit RPC9-like [Styela clava]
MEVISDKVPMMLSNYEMHGLLTTYSAEMKTGKHKTGQRDQNLSTITYEVLKYLEGTPCINQNEQCIKDACLALAPYNLSKAEKLQIMNLRPTTPVEISLIVEENEERISEEQIDEILEIVKKLPPGPGSEDKENEAEEMEEEVGNE